MGRTGLERADVTTDKQKNLRSQPEAISSESAAFTHLSQMLSKLPPADKAKLAAMLTDNGKEGQE